jgi:hypothetical protein
MADDEWANNNQPHLVNCGNFTGQFWNVMMTQDGDRVRLSTKLDIFNGRRHGRARGEFECYSRRRRMRMQGRPNRLALAKCDCE